MFFEAFLDELEKQAAMRLSKRDIYILALVQSILRKGKGRARGRRKKKKRRR